MSSNAIPGIRAQIEALYVCAEEIRLENDQRRLAQAAIRDRLRKGSAITAAPARRAGRQFQL